MNFKLIKILADGNFHSGVKLGEAMGMTRAAIWKNICQLEESGLEFESVKGKGYRLKEPLNLLDQDIINGGLESSVKNRIRDQVLLESVDSTNSYLREHSRTLGTGMYDLCLAERQVAGRGRRGRVWVSPFAKNIYLSLAIKVPGGFGALSGLSLAVGAAVACAVNEYADVAVGLKWPNDLWVGQDKVSGILVDVEGEHDGPVMVVIGVGVNVHMSREEAAAIEQPWTSLQLHAGRHLDRNCLVFALVNCLVSTIETFKREGFAAIKSSWDRFDVLKGRAVNLSGHAQSISGIYLGVDDQGLAVLEMDDGSVQSFSAGELSLRVAR